MRKIIAVILVAVFVTGYHTGRRCGKPDSSF